jgi:hypothetical protein
MRLELIGRDIWVANGTEIKFMGLLLGSFNSQYRLPKAVVDSEVFN